MSEELKSCRTCGVEKPLVNFCKNKNSKDGYNNQCKDCRKKYAAEHYLLNKDNIKKKTRAYKVKNKQQTKEYAKAYNKKLREEKREELIKYQRNYYKKNKEIILNKNKDYEKKYPEKKRAKDAVQRALKKGIIFRPDICSKCSMPPTASSKIEAHHDDYSKPIDVIWLCKSCHQKLHANPEIKEGE